MPPAPAKPARKKAHPQRGSTRRTAVPPPKKKTATITKQKPVELVVEKAAVRRYRKGKFWVISDGWSFLDTFRSGLLCNVNFNGNTTKIQCSEEDSSAEAVGTLKYFPYFVKTPFKMPEGVQYTALLKYSVSKGAFMIEGTAYEVLHSDFLLLNPDGSAIYGWISKPENSPL